MDEKVYCVWCGCKHVKKTEKCMACGKKLDPKDRLLVDFLVEHTKDKFKGDLEDSLYEAIKNYLLSHLYGVVVTIAIVGAVTAAAAAPKPDAHIQPVEQPPVIIAAEQETTAPVADEPAVEYYQLTEQGQGGGAEPAGELCGGSGMGRHDSRHPCVYLFHQRGAGDRAGL